MESGSKKLLTRFAVMFVATVSVCFLGTGRVSANRPVIENETRNVAGTYGVIKGIVRDKAGKPISRATVAVFRLGTSKLLKQVTATKSGKFFAKIVPGRYTVLAVAQGFNPVTLDEVKVERSSELVYGFRLERAGSGVTLPEKRPDSKSSKWAIRSSRRSIYQVDEGDTGISPNTTAVLNESELESSDTERVGNGRKTSSIVETYVGATGDGIAKGVNFATLRPVGESSDLLISGQIGAGNTNTGRFETEYSFNVNRAHRVKLRGTVASVGRVAAKDQEDSLSQLSFRATDQWQVREGVVLLFGVDYSRFIGGGSASSIAPRIGVQYDFDSKTRLRSAYTTRNEERTWSKVIQLESSQVLFAEPVSMEDIFVSDDEPQMNRSSRFEFGVERVLDNRTNVEANVFLDTIKGRGVGIDRFSLGAGKAFSEFVGRQEGGATGMRVVLNRRFNSVVSASGGYAFGTGQKFSDGAVLDPGSLFENGLFQTLFGKVDADFDSGTSVSTIFRFSPKATVFAIDPFEGRLAIYDPGLSVLVTQELPNWGLPIDAEATLDARNLFEFSGGLNSSEGALSLSAQKRMIRGSILVRF